MFEAFFLALLFSVAFGVMSVEELIERGKSEPKDRPMEYFAFSVLIMLVIFPAFGFSGVVGAIAMLPVLLVAVVGFLFERRKSRRRAKGDGGGSRRRSSAHRKRS